MQAFGHDVDTACKVYRKRSDATCFPTRRGTRSEDVAAEALAKQQERERMIERAEAQRPARNARPFEPAWAWPQWSTA